MLPSVALSSLETCSNIDSLAVSGMESTGVTDFVQEACETVDTFGRNYRSPPEFTPQSDLQELTKYFARPRIFMSGNLVPQRAVIASRNIDSDFLFNQVFPSNRLAGVRGVRFKMVFTIQVTAQPFNAGVMVGCFQYTPFRNTTFGFDRAGAVQACTNLPAHVRLDLSTNTMVQLHVPFLWSSDYMPLSPATAVPYGKFCFNQLLASQVVTPSAQPTFRIFLHLEDMELFGALPEKLGATVLQSSRVVRGPVEHEFESDARPLSSSLSAASRAASYLSRGIPSLSSIAAPAAWFLGKSAGVLRYLGYAKPQVQDPILRTFRTVCAQEGNVDIPSATLMVAPFISNHLPVDPAFGATDVDEMALSFVLGQYCQVFSGFLNNTAGNAQVIYGVQLSPSTLWYRENSSGSISGPIGNIQIPALSGATANSFMPSGICFWAQMFNFWRGPMKLRFTFAKSKMHTGRLIAAFVPDIAATSITTIQRPASELAGSGFFGTSGQTAIWDLKDGNVFEFECPYMGPAAFLNFTDGMGSFTLSVLDPLNNPATAPSSVPFLVEVCAGTDFTLSKFAGPAFPAHEYGTIRLQSGRVVTFENDMTQVTAGEGFSSVKQICMLPHSIPVTYNTTVSVAACPWFYNRTYPTAVPGPLGSAMRPVSFTPGGNAATCYLFAKGATDMHIYTQDNNNQRYLYRAVQFPGTGGYTSSSVSTGSTWLTSRPNSAVPCANDVGAACHFRFPLYNIVRRICPHLLNNLIWNPSSVPQAQAPITGGQFSIGDVGIFTNASDAISATKPFYGIIARAAADDAALAHYMGPPPLVLPSTNEGIVYDPDSLVYYTPGTPPVAAADETSELPGLFPTPVVTTGEPDFIVS